MNSSKKTALLMALSFKDSGFKIARMTKKNFESFANYKYYTPKFFVQVQEHLEEHGIALHIFHGSGYLLINLNSVSTNKTLEINQEKLQAWQITDEMGLMSEIFDPNRENTESFVNVIKKSDHQKRLEELWLFLCEHALKKQCVSYKDIITSNLDFSHQKQLDKPLKQINKECLYNRWPQLDSLVINQTSGRAMSFPDNSSWEAERDHVFNFDWENILGEFDIERYK